jgi:hypothetical protein
LSELKAAEWVQAEAFGQQVMAWAAAGSLGVAQPQLVDPGALNVVKIELSAAQDELEGCLFAKKQLEGARNEAQSRADAAQTALWAAAKAVLSCAARALAEDV